MGSNHSSVPKDTSPSQLPESNIANAASSSTNDLQSSSTKSKKAPPTNLTGVAYIEYKCRKKKRAWSQCVKEHYESQFLPGKSLEPEESDCDDLFEKYRHCYMRGLLKQRQEKGLEPPKEGTLLYEYMEEEDVVYPPEGSKNNEWKKN